MSLFGKKLASTHSKVNLSVSKYKDKERDQEDDQLIKSSYTVIYGDFGPLLEKQTAYHVLKWEMLVIKWYFEIN